jgi:hypothetical protein
MIDFQLVVQHRAAGVLTSTNFNLDALVTTTTHGTKRLASDSLFSLKVPIINMLKQQNFIDRINQIRVGFIHSKLDSSTTHTLQKSLINQIF